MQKNKITLNHLDCGISCDQTCKLGIEGIFVHQDYRSDFASEQAFVEGEIPFSCGSSNGGFWSRKVENALSFNGD
jgi:hypothetical protein